MSARRAITVAALALASTACGERAPEGPARDARPGAAPAAPEGLIEALASRRASPPAADADLARFRERLRGALTDHEFEVEDLTAHAWTAQDARGGEARLMAAEVRLGGKGPGERWVRVTSCPAAPDLAAAEEADWLTPAQGPGFAVVATDLEGLEVVESNWDDPQSPTTAWRDRALVVRAFGLSRHELLVLHEALGVGLQGEAPLAARARVRRTPPAAPPAPGPREAVAPFAGRWVGGTSRERLAIELRADGTLEAVEKRGERASSATGTWTASGDGVTLTLTHEDGRPMSTRVTVTGRPVDGALELRSSASKDVVIVRRAP